MEPNRPARRVPAISSSVDPHFADPPVTRRRPVDQHRRALGPPTDALAAVPDLTVNTTGGFHEFYAEARSPVGRALAITLRDSDLAVDAVDEAMVRAYERWDRVGALDNPAGWVYRVGLNYARSRLRRLLRSHSTPIVAIAELTVADPAIERALAALSVDQRATVVCRHLLGWSEAQTAAALRIRPGTVKSRLARALSHLEADLHHLRPEDRS